jgi:quinol monooxygenase YgiN
MPVTVNIFYTGENGNARAFAEEMISSGTAERIRAEEGNLSYDYYLPLEGGETVLLIDSWRDQEALDAHHASPMMGKIAELREKYGLHMRVVRYAADGGIPESDRAFIRE